MTEMLAHVAEVSLSEELLAGANLGDGVARKLLGDILLATLVESTGFYATLPEQLRVEVVEEQALEEGAAPSYSYLVEGVRKIFLYSVLGDVESLGDLLGGGTLYDEVHDRPFTFA